MFSRTSTTSYTENYSEKIAKVRKLIEDSDAIIIGAGAGLSAAAGLLYSGERFNKLFPDFIERYHLKDMYSAAFYQHDTLEEHWGYWSKHIYHNRYKAEINSTYNDLLKVVEGKNYFVITTNGDHLFILNNFDKKRLFYTQGDYGLFQCTVPCHKKTYDNKELITQMVHRQNDLKIPSELIPYCPLCAKPMTVNLRMDNTFVEDEGWHDANKRYDDFRKETFGKKVLFLELGIGYNTPSIIKYPFWQMTYDNKNATYISINLSEEKVPKEIINQSITIKGDICEVIRCLDTANLP